MLAEPIAESEARIGALLHRRYVRVDQRQNGGHLLRHDERLHGCKREGQTERETVNFVVILINIKVTQTALTTRINRATLITTDSRQLSMNLTHQIRLICH